MNHKIVDADKNDVERLIEIYSSPDLYRSREEASWFVESFFDYHHVKVIRQEANLMGAIFWNVVEEKHHGLGRSLTFGLTRTLGEEVSESNYSWRLLKT